MQKLLVRTPVERQPFVELSIELNTIVFFTLRLSEVLRSLWTVLKRDISY